jgi:hypothetical protein
MQADGRQISEQLALELSLHSHTPTVVDRYPLRSPHPNKVHIMDVRLNSGELNLLTIASEAIGSPVSSWARVTLLAEARKILRRAREQ